MPRKADIILCATTQGYEITISDTTYPLTPDFWTALEQTSSFAFKGRMGAFTARKEKVQRGESYWYAYRKINGKLYKRYLGKTSELYLEKLEATAVQLAEKTTPDREINMLPSGDVSPILKYPGAKWRLADWIVSHLPPHKIYLEPFFGSGAVFFHKAPSKLEIINDLDTDIVNLFRVLRDKGEELARLIALTPWSRMEYQAVGRDLNGISGERSADAIENARRFLVRCWQAHGTRTNQVSGWRHVGANGDAVTVSLWKQLPDRLRAIISRLQDAEIECLPALTIIDAYRTSKECCVYADPPYILDTRSGTYYKHEMTLEQHRELLEALDRHQGMVVLSGYAHPLYDERLKYWHRVSLPAIAEHGRQRTEVLWMNKKAATRYQPSLFESH